MNLNNELFDKVASLPHSSLEKLVKELGYSLVSSDSDVSQKRSGRRTRMGKQKMEGSLDHQKANWEKKGEVFAQLWRDGLLTDMELRAEGDCEGDGEKEFGCLVHAVVMSASSPYLKALLNTEIGRSAEAEERKRPNSTDRYRGVFTLKGVTPNALKAIVQYMYTEKLTLDADTVMATLAASNLLQLDGAKMLCSDWLGQHIDTTSAFMVQAAAERYNCSALSKTVQRFIDIEFSNMVKDPSFLALSESEVAALLARDHIRVQSESEVISALVLWTNADPEKRSDAFGRIISSDVVRLSLLSGADLHEVNMTELVQSNNLAMGAVGREACARLSGASNRGPRAKPRRWMDVQPRHCQHAMQSHRHAVYALMEFNLKLVSGSADHTIKLWDPLTWECVRTLEGHEDEVATLTQCRGFLLSGSGDRTIRVWDPNKDYLCTEKLQGHQDEVCALEVCRGKLVSASADHTVRVWNTSTWKCERILEGHLDVAVALAVCNNLLVSGSEDGTIKVWNPETNWACVKTINAHDSALATLTAVGNTIASGSADSTIKIWSPSTWTCELSLEGHRDQVCVLVENAGKLVSASGDATIKVWNLQTFLCERTLTGHEHPVVALSTCSGRLVSGSGDGIKVWGS
eukprot:g1758.t1